MAVMAREAWTDERLDDLAQQIDKGFDDTKVEIRDSRAGTDKGFARIDSDVRELRAEMRELRTDTKGDFDLVNARFDSLQRTMIIGFVTLFASIVASVIGGVFAAITLG